LFFWDKIPNMSLIANKKLKDWVTSDISVDAFVFSFDGQYAKDAIYKKIEWLGLEVVDEEEHNLSTTTSLELLEECQEAIGKNCLTWTCWKNNNNEKISVVLLPNSVAIVGKDLSEALADKIWKCYNLQQINPNKL